MIRPDDKTVKALAIVARQYPEVMSWLEQWRTHELDNLPLAINNTAVMQGRCQVLGELYKLVKDSPEIVAAKSL
jgi:hypothetical protein